jgi:hypothetical protein
MIGRSSISWLRPNIELHRLSCLGESRVYTPNMRSLTVRLPDQLVAEIESESRECNCAKSDIVRERLQRGAAPSMDSRPNLIVDLIGWDGLTADLSGSKKRYLKTTGFGKKRSR